jgi:hypothetical protein
MKTFSEYRILVENSKIIPTQRSTPDHMRFDGTIYTWHHKHNHPSAFMFIGEEDSSIILRMEKTHGHIFQVLNSMSSATDIDYVKGGLKKGDIVWCGDITIDDFNYFIYKQRQKATFYTRMTTYAGRMWHNVEYGDDSVDVAVFWCDQKNVTETHLEKIRKCYNLDGFYWACVDSQNYNYYGDEEVEKSGTSELKSKNYPDLTHKEILDILMKAHVGGYKMNQMEKDIVNEFRGIDPTTIKPVVTGGYDTRAEYEFRSRQSEKFDQLYRELISN